MDQAPNQREFTRVHLQVQTEVSALGRVIHSSLSQDLSMKGMLVRTDERLPAGTPCIVRLTLGEGLPEIRAEGTVVRDYEDGFAIQFTCLLGVESYEHLRNLVLYNAVDTERIEQEFHDHLGIRKKA
ncbi:MAG: PilZ domain-containing protein [Acidobacteria bacterium]|nr:PilZ domain-containing protein [Acidobacteriota bacterium]